MTVLSHGQSFRNRTEVNRMTEGMCCGLDQAIEYLEPKADNDQMFQIVNRLKYIRDKENGVRPRYHKGRHIKDWYTCGNCGFNISEIGYNFCPNCGYSIKWNSTRCLTGKE